VKGQKPGKMSTCISSWLEWELEVGGDFFENCTVKEREEGLCPKNHCH